MHKLEKDIVIVGAGGFAREVAWLIEQINAKKLTWNLLGFIDDNVNTTGKNINNYKVLGNIDYFNDFLKNTYYVIAIGNGEIRKKLSKKIQTDKIATLIHPDVKISNTNRIGKGSIICEGNILTVNIEIGEHVIINLDSTIGHDVKINSFVTVLPSTNISGNVEIGEETIIGTGTKIIQDLKIGKKVIIGAGTIAIRNIEDGSTVVGNPGKVIKIKKEV